MSVTCTGRDGSGLPEYSKDPAGGSGSRSAQTIVGQSASGGGNGIKSLPWVTAALVDQGAGVYSGCEEARLLGRLCHCQKLESEQMDSREGKGTGKKAVGQSGNIRWTDRSETGW